MYWGQLFRSTWISLYLSIVILSYFCFCALVFVYVCRNTGKRNSARWKPPKTCLRQERYHASEQTPRCALWPRISANVREFLSQNGSRCNNFFSLTRSDCMCSTLRNFLKAAIFLSFSQLSNKVVWHLAVRIKEGRGCVLSFPQRVDMRPDSLS